MHVSVSRSNTVHKQTAAYESVNTASVFSLTHHLLSECCRVSLQIKFFWKLLSCSCILSSACRSAPYSRVCDPQMQGCHVQVDADREDLCMQNQPLPETQRLPWKPSTKETRGFFDLFESVRFLHFALVFTARVEDCFTQPVGQTRLCESIL